MCVSYGFDFWFIDVDFFVVVDDVVLKGLCIWVQENVGEILCFIGKNLCNLNFLIVQFDIQLILELVWWGFFVNGELVKFLLINICFECLQDCFGGVCICGIVLVMSWYEMQKFFWQWNEFIVDDGILFGMVVVMQCGCIVDGEWYICYLIVMCFVLVYFVELYDWMLLFVFVLFSYDWFIVFGLWEIIDEVIIVFDEMVD